MERFSSVEVPLVLTGPRESCERPHTLGFFSQSVRTAREPTLEERDFRTARSVRYPRVLSAERLRTSAEALARPADRGRRAPGGSAAIEPAMEEERRY
jgi:hypothetical protein